MGSEMFPTGWILQDDATQPLGFLSGGDALEPESPSPILFPVEGHALTIAPTGSGKGRSCILPALLSHEGPAIVVDIKGENAAVTAPWRRSIGQEVHVIDPMGISGEPVSRFNPLDLVDPRMADAVDEARSLAEATTPSEPDGRNAYWRGRALHVVTGSILHAVSDLPKRKRSFVSVRDIMNGLTLATDFAAARPAIEALEASRHPEARHLAAAFRSGNTDTLATVMQVALESIAFVRGPQIERSLGGSDLDLDRVTEGAPMTIYLVLPAHMLRSHAVLLRLWLGALMTAILRRRRKPDKPTLFIVDEAAQIGELSALTSAVTLLRGYGVSTWSFFQNAGQIEAQFGKEAETIRANCRMVQVFGQKGEAGRHEIARALDVPLVALPADMPGAAEMLVSADGDLMRAKRPDYLRDPHLAVRARSNPLHGDGPVARERSRVPRGYLGKVPAKSGSSKQKRHRGGRAKLAPVHREIMGLLKATEKT